MNQIKFIRKQQRITQKALAEVAQVSQPFLHDLENGNRNAKPETMERIAAALGCSVKKLEGKEVTTHDEARSDGRRAVSGL